MILIFIFSPLPSVNAEGIPQSNLQKAYQRLTPALGVVRYATEVAHPVTGEVAKQERFALGLNTRPDGLVMAFGHMVLEQNRPVGITFTLKTTDSEMEFDAVLLKKPDDVNVVFLRLEVQPEQQLPYISFATSASLALGAPVAILGLLNEAFDHHPAWLSSRIGAVLEKPRPTFCLEAALPFAYVGGPVLDAKGQVVGVTGFDLSRDEGGELYVRSGHPLVYPSELFNQYIRTPPAEFGFSMARENAWLGVFTQALTPDFQEYWGLSQSGGLIVTTVLPGSPADTAGLTRGDIITRFGEHPITTQQDRDVVDFTKMVRETPVGQKVRITFLRDGREQTTEALITARPRSARDAQEYEDQQIGLTVREITTDLRLKLNLTAADQGVLIVRVQPGSAAQLANIRPGVILMRLGPYAVSDLATYQTAMASLAAEKPREVSVFGRFGASTGFFRLVPQWE